MKIFLQQKWSPSFGFRVAILGAMAVNLLTIVTGTAFANGIEESGQKYGSLTIESKLYGTIKKVPINRIGSWTVSNREILVTSETIISEDHGKAFIGAYVEVEGINTGKIFTASRIDVKRASSDPNADTINSNEKRR